MDGSPVLVLLNMAAAAALLIWSVRLVRTGFERAFGGQLRRWLRHSTATRVRAAATGAGAAILMQSSTAVAMLLAGFVSAGAIGGAAGLAIFLGADLGSAVVVQILNSRVALLTPLLLLVGVMIFLRSARRTARQVGRILIGLALIFLSLDLIRDASAPLSESGAAQAAMVYLAADAISAFLIAALFAWLVHSSVAAILLFATLAQQGLLPLDAAFAMVLGANLGGSLIAVFLTLKAQATVRQIVCTNLVLRGGGAVLALILLAQLAVPEIMPGGTPAQKALNLHLIYNLALLVLALPFTRPLMKLAQLVIADPAGAAPETLHRSALDHMVQNQPRRAFACAQRELVEVGNRIEVMLREAIVLFETYDDAVAQRLKGEMREIARMSLDLRVYLAGIRSEDKSEDTGTRAFDLSGVAVNLEAGADVIVRKMVELARRKHAEQLSFSDDGWRELTDFHDAVLRNVQSGIAVLMSGDVGSARELVEQKEHIRELEQSLERAHLKRLRQGLTESIETSAIHLELLRALKMLNTSFAMIAYPLLEEHGELLESRLAGQ
ncbi:Na/Pi cotransporter family protein [Alphaproteobacteria bacterium GH1-50]|uniref:Na/Pi cotransporter family protein n=1 Tax=Kangsaoukella pontilimi TaxID=2691042 RepID=A0A7C9MJ07_9RHOB|nr:Na/Pi cotransporter family protein [Kangsaoukella pontilimi]MXQ07395.1 Na/Pi cotransporter family protein [Kangsaoukella pontilimi]